MKRLSQHIIFVFLPLIVFVVFFIDLVFLYSQITITTLRIFREILLVGLLAGSWFFVQRYFRVEKLTIPQKLGRLTALLTLNYLVVLFLDGLLDPAYSDSFPPEYQNVAAVLFATIIGVLAPPTLIASLKILQELIFYRQKSTTRRYFQLFLLFTGLTSLSLYFTQQPLHLSFSGTSAQNTILFLITLFFMVQLSFHNDWIVYLPRKIKWLYFAIGIVLLSEIYSLFDVVYRTHLTAYSLFIASVSFMLYLFLLIYATVAILKLFIYLPTAKAFDRKIREVNSLNRLARTLNTELEPEKLIRMITRLSREVLECDSTWLEMRQEDGQGFKIVHWENLSEAQAANSPFQRHPVLVRHLYHQKQPVLIPDLHKHKDYAPLVAWKKEARSLLAVPLISNRDQLMGVLYALSHTAYAFDNEDLSLLEGFAHQAAIALENAQLVEKSIFRERIEQELKVAREVQLKLLPQQLPGLPGLEIAALSLAAYEVGGDYYDFFTYPDGALGLVIGDVSGKGTSAAFYVAEFKGVIQTLARVENDPCQLACQANRIMYPNMERKAFISAIVGRYEAENGKFSFVRAGHTPVLHWRAADHHLAVLQPPGLGIGLEAGPLFEKYIARCTVRLAPGDLLLLYTDGLTELRNQNEEEFGDQRLQEILPAVSGKSVEEAKETIFDQITEFLQRRALLDDLTLILIQKTEVSQSQEEGLLSAAVQMQNKARDNP
ncbi:MAG: GAF domain-containing protein [Calditrichaeota bacterium]|nr:MAG: GAF domain-containing protein [Calditrichota bacterium]